MKAAILAAIIAAAPATGWAQTAQVDRVEILNYGTYSGQITEHRQQSGTSAGINTVINRKLIEQTERIPARVGTRFGIEYVMRGRPQKQVVTLTCITRFPPAGLVNAKGEKFTKSEFKCAATIGERGVRTYSLDNSWEAVPGVWSLEFYDGSRKIGEKIFNLIAE